MTMVNPSEFIKICIDLPDNKQKLSEIDFKLDQIRTRFIQLQLKGCITDNVHESMYDETVLLLDFIGKLSKPLFGIRNAVENEYFEAFRSSPKTARKLWYKHYEHIHKPYSSLKNKCYSILEELDDEFIKIHKRPPRNYVL